VSTRPPLHRIFWRERLPDPFPPPPLARDTRTEIVVVGGGVAGLQCAQALREHGRSVVLLEGDTCGGGASGRSSGFVAPDSEMELNELVRNRPREEAQRLWEFAAGGVEAIRTDVERHGIRCDLQVQDSLLLAASRKGAAFVRREHGARQSFGYPSTLYGAGTIRSVLGAADCREGLRFPGTFGIDAYAYCRGLREVLLRSGVVIHERSPVDSIGEGEARANGRVVRADAVVLCLDRFLPDLGVFPEAVDHVQTFLSVSARLTDAQVESMFPETRLMVWDTDLIYQYFRVTGDNRLLLGASSVCRTYDRTERAAAPRILRKMRRWLRQKFPQVSVEVEYFWPGLIGVSKDFLPVAAQDPAHPTRYFVAGATGLPWAAALGRYVAEKIQSGRSDLDAAFDPRRRFPVSPVVQRVLGKRNAFAVSHGIVKYVP
jgi:gamma-glutamylputrescine oxidase